MLHTGHVPHAGATAELLLSASEYHFCHQKAPKWLWDWVFLGPQGEAGPRQVLPGPRLVMETEVKKCRQGETSLIDFSL